VTNLAAVLAGLVFVVTEGTVECGELAQLVALELVLAFGDRGSRLNDLVDQLLGFGDFFLGVGHDQTVQILILVLAWAASDLPLPSLTDPFPRIAILAKDLVSMFFKVLPRGPISKPMKLISG